jgi:quercetin dioxygenase-like cupin family protein
MERTMYRDSESLAARQEESWGALRWLANAGIGNAERLTLGHVIIKAGTSNPRHCHRTCEEVLYLLRGTVTHTLGDESFTMQPGDTISIPAGIFHNGINSGAEDAEMIIAYSTATRDFVLE